MIEHYGDDFRWLGYSTDPRHLMPMDAKIEWEQLASGCAGQSRRLGILPLFSSLASYPLRPALCALKAQSQAAQPALAQRWLRAMERRGIQPQPRKTHGRSPRMRTSIEQVMASEGWMQGHTQKPDPEM